VYQGTHRLLHVKQKPPPATDYRWMGRGRGGFTAGPDLHFKAVDSISWLDTSKQLTASLRWGKHCLQVVSIVCTQCKLTNFKTQLRILWWMPACIHAGLNPLCARWWTGGALPPSLKDTGRVRSLKLTTLEKLFYLPYRFNVFFA
jgi:hypothetical protein